MKKVCVVARAVKKHKGESEQDYQTRLIALDYIRYGKVVLVPDDFDPDATLERLAEEFNKEEPDFFAVEFELIVADA